MEGTTPRSTAPHDTLLPPRVYGAEDGGLGYSDLLGTPDAVIYIGCPTYFFSLAAHAVLYWDEQPIVSIPVAEGPQTPTFRVPGAQLAGTQKPGEDAYTGDGVHVVTYRYVYAAGEDISEATHVRVKCSLPGGQDPVGATAGINENLTAPTVAPATIVLEPGSTVNVSMPAWKNIAVGDVVTVDWAGYTFPLPPVTDPPASKFGIELGYDDLVRAGEGEHVYSHHLTGRRRAARDRLRLSSPSALISEPNI